MCNSPCKTVLVYKRITTKCFNLCERRRWLWLQEWIKWGIGMILLHDDVIKWKHYPRYWPFVRGIHRSPVNSLHKGQWRGALMLSLICARINGWVNNGEAGDMRCHRVHYNVIVMMIHMGWKCMQYYLIAFQVQSSKWKSNLLLPCPANTILPSPTFSTFKASCVR